MQPAYKSLFLDLMCNILPSVHLYVDQIAGKKKRAKKTQAWGWIAASTQCKFKRPFNEDDVQWVAKKMPHLRPAACPEPIVNKRHGGKKLPDYRFEADDSPTFEVKGPVRRTFFDPRRFGGNWTSPNPNKGSIRNDVRKILQHHCKNFPRVPHYLVLLLPCSKEALPASFYTIMEMIAADHPGMQPYGWEFREVLIPAKTEQGVVDQVPLTIALSAIKQE